MESQYFIFDGVKSVDMDLHNVRVEHSDFVYTPFVGGASIQESKSRKRNSPFFYGVNREPIEFTVQFSLIDKYGQSKEWTPQDRYRIGKWLIHDTYKEFISSDDLGKRYYVICVNPVNLGLINTEGYMEMTFRNIGAYGFSPVYVEYFDLRNNEESTIIELENKSNVLDYYFPKIEVKVYQNGTLFELKNLSDGGNSMKFDNLLQNETISIDCRNRIMLSDEITSNPFENFNKNEKKYWLGLVYGVNRVEVKGKVEIWVKSQFEIAQ